MGFLCCSITSAARRTFVAPQFAHPMTQKLLNLVEELVKNIENYSVIGTCLVMGGFTLLHCNISENNIISVELTQVLV
jgi:hypothetical protein